MTNSFIQKLSRHQPLNEQEIAALSSVTSKPRKYDARHDLIREGDEPGPVFVMLEGWANRYKILPDGTRSIMAFLMPGDCCDLHIGLLAEMDHSIQTVTPGLVATIGRREMDEIMGEHAGIAKAMYISQLVDEGILRSWITSIGRRTSIERVAHLMCELYLRARDIGLATDTEFQMPLSQLLLADALGMTPVHLNRVLRELRLVGAMAMGRGYLRITDPNMLVQIAGFDENYLHRRMRRPA